MPTKQADLLDKERHPQQHPSMNTKQPVIIAFASPKGGVGKSTTCLNIAGALAKRGKSVHVVDYDQTETLWTWYSTTAAREAFPNLSVEKAPPEHLKDYLHKFLQLKHDYVLIDLAGTLTKDMLLLGVVADLTITPCKLNVPDTLQASKLAENILQIAKTVGKPVQHRILINDVPSLLSNAQAHTLQEIDRNGLPRFETIIYTRSAAYTEPFLTGMPPHFADATRSGNAKAVDEINRLLEEINAITAHREQQEREAA